MTDLISSGASRAAVVALAVLALLVPAPRRGADPLRLDHRHRYGRAGRGDPRGDGLGDERRNRPQSGGGVRMRTATTRSATCCPGTYTLGASLHGIPRAEPDRAARLGQHRRARRPQARGRGARGDGDRRERHDAAADREGRPQHRARLQGGRQPAAQPVPQLPGALEPGRRARRPAQLQNAEIDTPGRALSTSVNGMQRNSNAFRIDGAVSVNIWLPHHVGYVNSAETIDTVNISTNNFDADQGMAAGAAVTVVTKSGHERAARLGVLPAHAGRAQRQHVRQQRQRAGEAEPVQQHLRRHARRADPPGQAVLLRRPGSATRAAAASTAPTSRRPPGCGPATSARSRRHTRPSASTTPSRAAPAASAASSSRTSRSRRAC